MATGENPLGRARCHTRTIALLLGGSLVATAATGTLVAVDASARRDESAAIARSQMATVVSALEHTLVTAFVDRDPERAEQLATVRLSSTVPGRASFAAQNTTIQDEAAALLAEPVSSPRVVAVAVKRVGEGELRDNPGGTISVIVDLEITRTLSPQSIDWVSLTPYELVLEPHSGRVLDLIVYDEDLL